MNKLLLFFLSITVLLSSCKKDNDYIFSQTPDERINAAMAKYQTLLTGAENGWKGEIVSSKGVSYAFYFKFTNDNRVKMLSDFSGSSATTLQDAGYRLREQQQPTLIFDTYSYVHILADPNEANAGVFANINTTRIETSNSWFYIYNDLDVPDLSVGLSTDFEFIIDEDLIKNDTIQMIGKINGAKLNLIRATKPEADIYTNGQWNASVSNYLGRDFLTYYDRLIVNGKSFDVRSYTDSSITFNWLDGSNNTQTKTVNYTSVLLNNGLTHAIALSEPIVNGAVSFDSIAVVSWNGNSTPKQLNILANNAAGTITETARPLKIDAGAPARWLAYARNYNNPYAPGRGAYWITWDGFYVNGQTDAFHNNQEGIDTRFFNIALFPTKFFTTSFNVFAPQFLDANFSNPDFKYFAGVTLSVTAGLGKFKYVAGSDYPTTEGAAKSTLSQLTSTDGYYFVQLPNDQYDMVSAKDGKTWLSWYLEL